MIKSQNLHLAMDAVCEQMEIKTPNDEDMTPIRNYLSTERFLDQSMFFELVDHMISCFIDPKAEKLGLFTCREIKQLIQPFNK